MGFRMRGLKHFLRSTWEPGRSRDGRIRTESYGWGRHLEMHGSDPLPFCTDFCFSPVAPSDSSSQAPEGTFFTDTLLPNGAPGINVLTAALPDEAPEEAAEEDPSDLGPLGVDLLEAVQPADDEPDRRRALVRFREILLDDGRAPSEKIQALLALGAERFGVENGHLTRIDTDEGVHRVVQFEGDSPPAELPITTDLSDTYCRIILENEQGMAVEDAEEQGWASDPAYEKLGFSTYLGARVFAHGEFSGTVCFADRAARTESFGEEDTTFLTFLAEAIGRLLEETED